MDLAKYLDEKGAEGTADSEGSFSVNQAEAARKLARFALPDTYSWALKLIQAAIAYGCSEVKVTQERNTTSFFFRPSSLEDIPTPNDVIQTIISSDISGDSPLQRTVLALRALVEQSDFSFLLSLCREASRCETLYAGHDFSLMEESERERLGNIVTPGIQVRVSLLRSNEGRTGRFLGGLLIGPRRDVLLSKELIDKAYLCPIPLLVDGLRINRLLTHPRFGFVEKRRPLVLGGVDCPKSMPTLSCSELERKQIGILTDPRRAERPYTGSTNFPVWYLLYADLNENTEHVEGSRHITIDWHRDGVVVQREKKPIALTSRCHLTIFLSADGLQTDLTGFRLQETQEKKERVKAAFGSVVNDLYNLMSEPDTFFRQDTDEQSEKDREVRNLERSHRRSKKLGQLLMPILFTSYMPVFGASITLIAGASIYIADYWPSTYQLKSGQKALLTSLTGDTNKFIQAYQRETEAETR